MTHACQTCGAPVTVAREGDAAWLCGACRDRRAVAKIPALPIDPEADARVDRLVSAEGPSLDAIYKPLHAGCSCLKCQLVAMRRADLERIELVRRVAEAIDYCRSWERAAAAVEVDRMAVKVAEKVKRILEGKDS